LRWFSRIRRVALEIAVHRAPVQRAFRSGEMIQSDPHVTSLRQPVCRAVCLSKPLFHVWKRFVRDESLVAETRGQMRIAEQGDAVRLKRDDLLDGALDAVARLVRKA